MFFTIVLYCKPMHVAMQVHTSQGKKKCIGLLTEVVSAGFQWHISFHCTHQQLQDRVVDWWFIYKGLENNMS